MFQNVIKVCAHRLMRISLFQAAAALMRFSFGERFFWKKGDQSVDWSDTKCAGALFGAAAAVSSSFHFLMRSSLARNNYKITLVGAILPALLCFFVCSHSTWNYFTSQRRLLQKESEREKIPLWRRLSFHTIVCNKFSRAVCMWKSEWACVRPRWRRVEYIARPNGGPLK